VPLIGLFFERGHFSGTSSFGTAQAFLAYAVGLPVFSLETLFVHAFFARKDTKTPVKLGIACGVLDIVLALILLGPLQYLGVAWAFLVTRTAKALGLAILLRRRCPGILGPGFGPFLVRLLTCNILTCGALWMLAGADTSGPAVQGVTRCLLLPLLGTAIVFAGSSYVLRIEEFRYAVALIRNRKRAIASLRGEEK